jgi:hypothetical protein
VSWDFEGVKRLLHAGADPNDCGYENGIAWESNDLLGRFNHLGGYSPLLICKESECIDYFRSSEARFKEDHNKIEELLIADGARSFEENWASGIQLRAKNQVRKELERGRGVGEGSR